MTQNNLRSKLKYLQVNLGKYESSSNLVGGIQRNLQHTTTLTRTNMHTHSATHSALLHIFGQCQSSPIKPL